MRRPKHNAEAFEFAFVAQAFNLAGQTATDGARAQAEIDAQGAARAESESRQMKIEPEPEPQAPAPAVSGFRVTVHERARLRPGDVVRLIEGECKVLRVTDCAAVIELPAPPPRKIVTRFGKSATIAGRPSIARISANAECEIVSRSKA